MIVQYKTGIIIIIEPNHPTLFAANGNAIAPFIYKVILPIPITDLIKLKNAYLSIAGFIY